MQTKRGYLVLNLFLAPKSLEAMIYPFFFFFS